VKANKLQEIDVVAGLLFHEGRLLACQRSSSGPFPLKWEFPGGKVQKGETWEGALRRELREELGIEVKEATEVFCSNHAYPNDYKVNLKFFEIHRFTGTVQNRVFHAIEWVYTGDLHRLDFLAGDLPIIEKLTSR
jgi:8-oxo-dGTP diphosphatase